MEERQLGDMDMRVLALSPAMMAFGEYGAWEQPKSSITKYDHANHNL